MKYLSRVLSFLSLVVVANSAAAATYVYTAGSNYASATGVYTTAMTISGSITTSVPLAANLTNVNIGPSGSNLVTAWSFNDGINTLTNLNSVVYAANPSNFIVSTNASGQLTAFLFVVISPPPPNTVGQAMNVIAVGNTSPFQQGVTAAPCNTVTTNACSSLTTFPNSGYSATTAGAFALVATAVPAPMLTPALLALLTLTLLAFVYARRTRHLRA